DRSLRQCRLRSGFNRRTFFRLDSQDFVKMGYTSMSTFTFDLGNGKQTPAFMKEFGAIHFNRCAFSLTCWRDVVITKCLAHHERVVTVIFFPVFGVALVTVLKYVS